MKINFILEKIKEVSSILNIKPYIIGGWVRNGLLGIPSSDIDITVAGGTINSGMELAERLHYDYFPEGKLRTYPELCTAKLKIDNLELEFVATRKEIYISSPYSRVPAVTLGTFQDDLERRDFTINAIAYDILEDKIIDRFGGIEDLKNGIIRCIGNDYRIKFKEDPLRILRGIRIASQLGFMIETNTILCMDLCKENLNYLTQSRFTSEFEKILSSPNASKWIRILYEKDFLDYHFPELVKLGDVEIKNGKTHKNNFYHTMEVLESVCEKSNSLTLRWAALLHDIGKPDSRKWDDNIGWTFHNHPNIGASMIPKIFKRLQLPLDRKMKEVQTLVNLHMRPIIIADDSVTDSAVRRLLTDAGYLIDDLMILCQADITSKKPEKKKRLLENFEKVKEKIKILTEKDNFRNFKIPINGHDIMEYLGCGPFSGISEIKDNIKEAIIEGKIKNTHEAALEMMYQECEKMGLKKREA